MKTLILLLCTLVLSNTYAKSFKLKDSKGSSVIKMSDDWTYLKDSMGLPHVFVSKGENPNSTLSITHVDIKELKLDPKKLAKTQEVYQDGRKRWAKKRKIEIITFTKYVNFKNMNKVNFHVVGLKYKLNENNFLEKSYYAECKKKLVHLKSVVFYKHLELGKQLLDSVDNFRCQYPIQ